jgi:hypothetical protein
MELSDYKSSQSAGLEISRLLPEGLLTFSQVPLDYTPHHPTLISMQQLFNIIFPFYACVGYVVSSFLF